MAGIKKTTMFIKSILVPVIAIFVFGAAVFFNSLFLSDEEREKADSSLAENIATATEPAVVEPQGVSVELEQATSSRVVDSVEEKRLPVPLTLAPERSLSEAEEAKAPDVISPAVVVPDVVSPPPLSPTPLPALDEDMLKAAVVRIRCGNVYGSGFTITSGGLILTAAHVLIEAIDAGVSECDVIFPRKHPDFGFYSETYYRRGMILGTSTTAAFYKEKGFDVALLRATPLADEPVFSGGFPYVNYPFCGPETLGDEILLFGYAANVGTSASSLGSVLSRFEGTVLEYEDVNGTKQVPSKNFSGGSDYLPIFTFSVDESRHHPIVLIASNNNFSGASGGLVFDTAKRCIIGINSAVGTASGDPRVFGLIYNFEFPEIKNWIKDFLP